MRNNVLFFVVCGICWACSTKQPSEEGVKLSGKVEQFPQGGIALVEVVGATGAEPIDTLQIADDGSFATYLKINEPAFYRVNFAGRQIITLILTGKETEVTLNADGNNPQGFYEISGSYDTDYKNQIDELMQSYQSQVRQLQQIQLQARADGDAEAFQNAQLQLIDLAKKTEKELKKLIRTASPSLASLYGLQMIDVSQNVAFIDSIATELQAEMPKNIHVNNLLSQMSSTKSLAIGEIAPEISLPNPEGEIIKLSALRGKYVLIDFWAAWCGPCRRENPNVVRVYKKYKDKNFEILGVSLDRNRDKWLQAIEQDGLPWLHVSDLKYWKSEAAVAYQIRAIPATYLIDPDGRIIAKNLRGASLEAKLKELFEG